MPGVVSDACSNCGGDLDANSCAGLCATCISPEALTERVSHMPQPLRSIFEAVGSDLGILELPDRTL